MSYGAFQAAWVEALTDQGFRSAMVRDSARAISGRGLTRTEARAFASVDSAQFAVAASLWQEGRLASALEAFPLSARVVETPLDELAASFSREMPPRTTRRKSTGRVVEAESAFDFLLRGLQAGRVGPPWLGELLRFEMESYLLLSSREARLSAARTSEENAQMLRTTELGDVAYLVPFSGEHVSVVRFSVRVTRLAAVIRSRQTPANVEREPTDVIFVLQPSRTHVTALRGSPQVVGLLAACNGVRSTLDVTKAAGVELSSGLVALRQLWARGALGMRVSSVPKRPLG